MPAGVVPIRATYPIVRYYAAFDLAVAAAGYNAFHELIAAGVPNLFVPMPRHSTTRPRGHGGRARAEWGRGSRDPRPGLEEQLERLLDPEGRGRRKAASRDCA